MDPDAQTLLLKILMGIWETLSRISWTLSLLLLWILLKDLPLNVEGAWSEWKRWRSKKRATRTRKEHAPPREELVLPEEE